MAYAIDPHTWGPPSWPVAIEPVRIKFYNLLPTGAGGDLFLPVDETVPGAGVGPAMPGAAGDKYTQNRATIHLHGNNTVWISDGKTHQWITPAGETTPYPEGVSARNVPDMPAAHRDCDDPLLPDSSGCMTFYYTNAQSARLMFYHDHAMGITRLNVYAGEAAGYVITDAGRTGHDQRHQCVRCQHRSCDVPPAPGQTLRKSSPVSAFPWSSRTGPSWTQTTIFAQDPTWNWGTGPRDFNGKITAAVRATSGTPMSTCRPRIRGTLPAQIPSAAGTMVPGSIRRSPTCVNGLPVGCIEVGPVPNEYYQPL